MTRGGAAKEWFRSDSGADQERLGAAQNRLRSGMERQRLRSTSGPRQSRSHRLAPRRFPADSLSFILR